MIDTGKMVERPRVKAARKVAVDVTFTGGCAGIRTAEAQCDPVVGVAAGIGHERGGTGRGAEAEVDLAGRSDSCAFMSAVQADQGRRGAQYRQKVVGRISQRVAQVPKQAADQRQAGKDIGNTTETLRGVVHI